MAEAPGSAAASRTIQSGDCIEYDVYLNNNVVGLGGIDIRNSDNGYWRDSSGWADQNGIGERRLCCGNWLI